MFTVSGLGFSSKVDAAGQDMVSTREELKGSHVWALHCRCPASRV